jgi:CRISPR-associated protein (TIGR02710 family)
MPPPYTLLIATVGGSPEPIVASLKHWRPSRALFVTSPQTRPEVEGKVLPLAQQEGVDLAVGCYDCHEVPDAQDFTSCVRKMRDLVPEVSRWLARGPDYEVVVDYTGGTKTMSAAVAVQAHSWGCRFAYVGGSERTKNDVGVVVSGKEQVLHVRNPWEALGCQAIEDARTLFDQAAYGAAGQLLQRAFLRVQDPARKRELSALKTLADAYDSWDRFQHRDAVRLLGEAARSENDFRSLFGPRGADTLLRQVAGHREYLQRLLDEDAVTRDRARVIDLLANAGRRLDERRFDDAVARLYRALEALAQVRLHEAYGIDNTGRVALDRIPEPLRTSLAARARNGAVFFGLQDDYAFLRAQNDPLGVRFHELGLDDWEKSPLVARNQSLLAHGFEPVSEKAFAALWDVCRKLSDVPASDLPVFPRLGAD